MLKSQQWETEIAAIAGVEFLIAEMDGTMIDNDSHRGNDGKWKWQRKSWPS